MKLLINADDLGYTPAINRAIFDLHARSVLFSASLLANMPFSDDAIAQLPQYPHLGVGVHLNLTKGRPRLPAAQIPSLVGRDGNFHPTKSLFARAAAGIVQRDEIKAELAAQIEQILQAGIQPTHLDSHSHWHVLPSLRKLVIELGHEYGIPGLRQAAPRRTLLPHRLWLAAVPRDGCNHPHQPDYMLSLHNWMQPPGQPREQFRSPEFLQILRGPNITLELVTHPGEIHDPHFPPDTLLTHQRQWEYDFLQSVQFRMWCEQLGATVVRYPVV